MLSATGREAGAKSPGIRPYVEQSVFSTLCFAMSLRTDTAFGPIRSLNISRAMRSAESPSRPFFMRTQAARLALVRRHFFVGSEETKEAQDTQIVFLDARRGGSHKDDFFSQDIRVTIV